LISPWAQCLIVGRSYIVMHLVYCCQWLMLHVVLGTLVFLITRLCRPVDVLCLWSGRLDAVVGLSTDAGSCDYCNTALRQDDPLGEFDVNPLIPTVAIWVQVLSVECPDVKNYKWRLNPVWHRMLYSCTHMATVGINGLTSSFIMHWIEMFPTRTVRFGHINCLLMLIERITWTN